MSKITFDIPGAAWTWFEGSGLYQDVDDLVHHGDPDWDAAHEASKALHDSVVRKVGFGRVRRVTCSPKAAQIILEQADYYSWPSHSETAEERTERLAVRRVADRINRKLEAIWE